MAIIFARGKAAGDHMTPQLALQGQAQQLAGCRIGLTDATTIINHDNPARQQIQQVLQAIGQPFFLGKLGHALRTDHRQLAGQLRDTGLQQAVGIGGRGQLDGGLRHGAYSLG